MSEKKRRCHTQRIKEGCKRHVRCVEYTRCKELNRVAMKKLEAQHELIR